MTRPHCTLSRLYIAATQEYMHIDRLADGSKLDETNSTVRTIYTCRLRSSLPVGPDRRDWSIEKTLSYRLAYFDPRWCDLLPNRLSCDPKYSQAVGGSVLDTVACGVQHQKLQSESNFNNETYILSLTWELLIPDLINNINLHAWDRMRSWSITFGEKNNFMMRGQGHHDLRQ